MSGVGFKKDTYAHKVSLGYCVVCNFDYLHVFYYC